MGLSYLSFEPMQLENAQRNRVLPCLFPWIILSAFTVFWIVFFSLTSPQPGGTDVFVFRDAGCNWAAGRGLVAASVPHANTVMPTLFASYTPGALILFGLAASLFGCSGWMDTFYNLVLASAACSLLYRCFSLAVASGWQRVTAAVLLGAVLPTGLVVFDSDRPEMPAFCLMVMLLLLWRNTMGATGKTLVLGSVGFVFLIHPYAGIAGWLLLAFLLAFSDRDTEPGARTGRLSVMIAGSALYALVVGAWALAMWRQDPTSLHRFLEHAMGQGTGAGVVLHGASTGNSQSAPLVQNGYAVALRQLFNPAFPVGAASAVSLLGSAVVVAVYAFRGPDRARRLLECGVLIFVLVIFPFAVFPRQANYFGLSRALLLAVLLIGGYPLSRGLRRSMAPLYLILIAFVFTAPWTALGILQSVDARASYYREQEQAKRVSAYLEQHGVHNPPLLVDSGHYFLYKPFFSNLYNRSYVEQGDATSQFRALVLCYSASRAFSRAELPWEDALQRDNWRLIDGGEDAVRVTILGHPVMRRNWSWMCDVYARQLTGK
jgi:hypothetical protein